MCTANDEAVTQKILVNEPDFETIRKCVGRFAPIFDSFDAATRTAIYKYIVISGGEIEWALAIENVVSLMASGLSVEDVLKHWDAKAETLPTGLAPPWI